MAAKYGKVSLLKSCHFWATFTDIWRFLSGHTVQNTLTFSCLAYTKLHVQLKKRKRELCLTLVVILDWCYMLGKKCFQNRPPQVHRSDSFSSFLLRRLNVQHLRKPPCHRRRHSQSRFLRLLDAENQTTLFFILGVRTTLPQKSKNPLVRQSIPKNAISQNLDALKK